MKRRKAEQDNAMEIPRDRLRAMLSGVAKPGGESDVERVAVVEWMDAAAWRARPTDTFEAWIHGPDANDGQGFSEGSRKVYGAMWRKFCRFCESMGVMPIDARQPDVDRFVRSLADEHRVRAAGEGQRARGRDPGGSTRLARRYASLIAKVHAHAVRVSAREANLGDATVDLTMEHDSEPPRPRPTAIKGARAQALRDILTEQAEEGAGWRATRDRVIVELASGSGLTSLQLRYLKTSNVVVDPDDDRCVLHPVPTREGKPRPAPVPVSERASKLLVLWLRERAKHFPAGVLFPATSGGGEMSGATLYRVVAQSMERVSEAERKLTGSGDPLARHLGPRTLRHTFAVRQLKSGHPVAQVCQWLDIDDGKSAQPYVDLTKPEDPRPV